MCSYCGCRESLPIIARWSEEHDEIVNALGQVRRAVAGGVPEEVLGRTAELRALLDPHTASEERSMFAELRLDPEFTEVVDALCAEHVDISAGIARVEAGEPGAYDDLDDVALEAKVKAKYPGVYDDLPMTASGGSGVGDFLRSGKLGPAGMMAG